VAITALIVWPAKQYEIPSGKMRSFMGNIIKKNPGLTSAKSSETFVIITAFLSLLAIVGFTLYGLPFFYDFFSKDFGWERKLVTSGNALGKIVVAPLFGFLAGWLVDRYGPRRMLMAGTLMTGAALIGLSLINSLGMFYLFYVFIALGYVFGGPLPCQVLISRRFAANRGKAMGIAYLGIGTGGFLVPLIASGLEKNFGWHLALTSLGFLVIIIAFPLAYFIKDPAANFHPENKREIVVPVKNILKNRNFYLLAFGSMCSIGAVGGVFQNLKYYMSDLSFTQLKSAHIMSLVLLMSLAGRVLMGILADVMCRKYVMILIYLIVGSAIPLLLLPDFPGRLYVFSVIFGIGLGGDYMIIPLMAGDLFGVKTLGRVMGIILVADGLAEALVPVMVNWLYNGVTKSYSAGFAVLISMAIAGAAIVSFLPGSGLNSKPESAG
jgi:MFS family permease